MRNIWLGVVAVCFLALTACGTTPAQYELFSCVAYTETLDKAAELREQSKLSTKQIEVVQKTKNVLDPICLAPPPNIDQSALNTVVDAGVRSLSGIVQIFLPSFRPSNVPG